MSAQAVETERATAMVVKADELRRLLHNVALACSTDRTWPILGCVRLEHDGSGCLTAAATDRFRLFAADLHTEDNATYPPFAVNVTDVKRLIALLKSKDVRGIYVRLSVTTETLTIDAFGTAATVQLHDGDFPRYRSLFPTDTDEDGGSAFGVNPEYLACLAKLDFPGSPAVRIHAVSPTKPIRVSVSGEPSWRGLIMPVRNVA